MALMQRIANRDPEALRELFGRYQQLVFSSALHLVQDGALAEDITLTVFTHVWEHAAKYLADRAKVTTWLLMMARNRSIDALRRRSARREHQRVDWREIQSTPMPGSTESTVEERLRRERVHEALRDLPADQAQALALAFFEGRTHQEIADSLQEPLGTIKTRIRLALKKLREALRSDLGGERDI
jgi:RNA polymerase sigma-70 factor (ECF subfamily)